MSFKHAILLATVLAAPAAAQSDSVSRTLFTRRDAKIAVGALAATAAISYFDPKIASFFSDTSLAHVRAGQRFDNVFTHINETTLTLAGIAAYGAGRLSKSPALTDIAFHTTDASMAEIYKWGAYVITYGGVSFTILRAYRKGVERGDW